MMPRVLTVDNSIMQMEVRVSCEMSIFICHAHLRRVPEAQVIYSKCISGTCHRSVISPVCFTYTCSVQLQNQTFSSYSYFFPINMVFSLNMFVIWGFIFIKAE